MPPALIDLVAVAALLGLLAVGFAHPSGRVEAAAGMVAAGAVVTVGGLPVSAAVDELGRLFPVVAFLAAILVVAEQCAAAGLFTAVGAVLSRLGRGRPVRMLTLAFVAAAVTTAVLSLDATVVLLTPVVAAAAAGSMVRPRPMVYACVRLANSASLLLPVSNLTNLLALPALDISFLRFAALMAPVWLVVIGVEYVGHRVFFARDLRAPHEQKTAASHRGLPVLAVTVVAAMLVGFAVASPLGVAPAWVAAGAAVVLVLTGLRQRRTTLREALHAAHLSFAVYVLCLGVVVAAVTDSFLGDLVATLVPAGTGLPALLAVAALATVLANTVNNLPATLLLVPLVAPLGTTAVLAALIGLNVGSGLTYTGSLANLLWRRTLVRTGRRPSARDFHLLAAAVTPPALVLAVVVLCGWSRVV